jgi:histidine triad (HIT) family protein
LTIPANWHADNLNMADTIFSKIIAKQIPAKFAYEDDQYVVIHDINGQAPVHLLVIPRKPIATLNDLTPGDRELVGGCF